MLFYDTSGLSGLTITAAYLQLYGQSKTTTVSSFTMAVQNGMPTYPHDPATIADFNRANYSGNGGNITSANMTIGAYNTLTLNATGISWINTTGTTKFILREVEHDINNLSFAYPPIDSGNSNSFLYYSYEQGAGYRPTLVVTYTIIAPSITTVAASNVAYSSARLNSNIVSDGGNTGNITAWFAYGTSNITGNLLTNGGFESGTDNWTKEGAGTYAQDNTTVKIGNSSLKIDTTGVAFTNGYQSVACSNNTEYTIGAWVYATTPNAARLGTYDGSISTQSSFHSGSSAWEYLSTNVTTNGTTLYLYARLDDTNTVAYYDSMILTKGKVTSPQSGLSQGNNPYADVTGLTSSTTYYFNAIAENGLSQVTGTPLTFTTSSGLSSVTGVSGNPTDTTIDLKWTKATGSTNTLIRYRTDTYAANITDGTLAYLSTADSFSHSGLTAGLTYYYTFWGESGGTYSTNGTNFVMTTLTTVAGTQTMDTPGMPFNFLTDPDYTNLSHIEPFYTIINNVADSYGMPRNNLWTGLWLVALTLLGFAAYIKIHSFEAPAVVIIAGGWLGVSLGVMSGWIGLFLTIGAIILYALKSGIEFQNFRGE